MKKILSISAIALAAAIGGVAVLHAENAGGPAGQGATLQTASWWGGDKGGRHGGPEGHHGKGDWSGRGGEGRGPGMLRRIEAFDADKDGAITKAEIDQFGQGQITKFDANKDGSLSLDEYQALWLDQMRERMVDAFQEHDNDGNGQVTADEFNERFAGLVERLDRNGDGQVSADDRGGDRRDGRRGPPPPKQNDAVPGEAVPPPQP